MLVFPYVKEGVARCEIFEDWLHKFVRRPNMW